MSVRKEKQRVVTSGKVSKMCSITQLKNISIKKGIPELLSWIKSLLIDPRKLPFIAGLFIIFEVILNIFVIHNVNYTEIDWKAYMQQVEGFLNGTMDYSKLKGDTGALVYPAGFVYIYSMLYYLTSYGKNIKLCQYIFAIFYIILLVNVFRIYARSRKVPPYVLILIFCTSYRVHSIFVLRLFNDSIAMILLFISLNAFLDDKWYTASFIYSLAVSVKMNILLFSPAILIVYLCNLGLLKTIIHLTICAIVQLILGLPFLLENPYNYIVGAFNFGRIFEYKWTVNWKIISEQIFLNPKFHLTLLFLHLAIIMYFIPYWMKLIKCYAKLKIVEKDIKPQMKKDTQINMSTLSQLFILPLFTCNFIGIVLSRSLHYQFYIWYYHTLPYLAWSTHYRSITRIFILGIIELCWNIYPSTFWSSAALHLAHLTLLFGLYKNKIKHYKIK